MLQIDGCYGRKISMTCYYSMLRCTKIDNKQTVWQYQYATDLWYNCQLWAQIVKTNLSNIDAIYNDLSSRRLNDSKQTKSQRRFAGTSTTHNSNLTTKRHLTNCQRFSATVLKPLMTTMRVVGECFFWYRLTRVFPDKFHRAVKRLCVLCVCVFSNHAIFFHYIFAHLYCKSFIFHSTS